MKRTHPIKENPPSHIIEAPEAASVTALNHFQGGFQSSCDWKESISHLAKIRNHRLRVSGSLAGKIDLGQCRRILAMTVPALLAEGLGDEEIYLFMDFELDFQGHQLPPMLLAKELRRFGVNG